MDLSDIMNQAQASYPWVRRFPNIAITTGTGPFHSESYMPRQSDNPSPGNYTIQIRDPRLNSPTAISDLLGRESLDWIARTDPMYQSLASQFMTEMTPQQWQTSQERFNREGSKGSFEDWMREAEIQEYVGGYLTPRAAPGWSGYTPRQSTMLDYLKSYLSR